MCIRDRMWAVCDRTTHRVIGAAWMDGDPLRRMKMNEARMIGYLFSKECWGKGDVYKRQLYSKYSLLLLLLTVS